MQSRIVIRIASWPLYRDTYRILTLLVIHSACNGHGPMVAQRCLGAKTNSPRKFALVSCFELPKLTQNELRFGLILF